LLSSLGVVEPDNSRDIIFYPYYHKPHFPYHVSFHIVLVYTMKSLTQNIFHVVVDEGVSTCMMSLACLKDIGQPKLFLSPMFLTTFEFHSFFPHGIIPSFPMQLEGKTMCVEVDVVDEPLDYNLFLGCSWNYAMKIVVSSIFSCTMFSSGRKDIKY